ncbi:MAG: hypothetical protein WAT71_00520 [Ignavibacteria bacterium]
MKNVKSLPDIIPVEAIRERDIDMLLLEELKCSKEFRDWYIQRTIGQIGLNGKHVLLGVWQSLRQVDLGESDLAFIIKMNNEKILFLIENKIDTNFMPAQANRYRNRGECKIEEGECSKFYTILFAPRSYINRNDDFDFYLEYEEVRDWFKNQSKMKERAKFKSDIINIAIEKLRRGYNPVKNEAASILRNKYFEYCKNNFPFLGMYEPNSRLPKRSGFIRFKPKGINLKKTYTIIHKTRGVVDLQLNEKGKDINYYINKYEDSLTKNMEIVKTGKTFSIRINIPEMDTIGDFDDQIRIIKIALKKVNTLHYWAKKNL